MQFSRRAFTGGALGLAAGSQFAAPAFAQAGGDPTAAVAAIRAYAEAHHSYFELPGLTLGLTTPNGFATVLNFGFANADLHSRSARIRCSRSARSASR